MMLNLVSCLITGNWLIYTHHFLSGRSWAVQELREKSWDDLHSLWWVCVKERNRIATSQKERERLNAGHGEYEANERTKVVSFCPFQFQ